MKNVWKESIYLQRENLARELKEPMEALARVCAPAWPDREKLNAVLEKGFFSIPHCTFAYCVDLNSVQISDNFNENGLYPGQFGRDRASRPYMREPMPVWGFLLSDAYVSMQNHRPSLTALTAVRDGENWLGYLGADFDLRNLPVTGELYREPAYWRQIKGDPAIRGTVFDQCRVESPLDKNKENFISVLTELIADRGVFQCQIHFSSSQAVIWTVKDPFRYRLLDQEALTDPDICLLYPLESYPLQASIPKSDIEQILKVMYALRVTDPTIYLRLGSINIFNGMISLTFSCDGTHYMSHVEFLMKDIGFWF